MVDKERLLFMLNKNNIEIDINELDEIIDKYDNLIGFLMEGRKNKPRYGFLDKDICTDHSGASSDYDTNYFNIFTGIIKLKQKNILYILDYTLLTVSIEKLRREYNPIYATSKYIDFALIKNEKYKDNFPSFISNFPFDYFRCRNLNKIKFFSSFYVSDSYKDIMREFDMAYRIYLVNWEKYNNINDVNFKYLITLIYYYLIKNDCINKEPDKVLSFIKNLYSDLDKTIGKANLYGIEKEDEMYIYIDHIYEQFGKVKIIK